MVKIRLTRMGSKKRPFYRVTAIDERKQRDGRPLEFLGTYDPGIEPAALNLDLDGIESWVGKGAQLDTVRSLVNRVKREGNGRRPDMAKRGKDSAELVSFLAKAIVSNPDDVEVEIEDDGELIELETADGDRGCVIGRQGRSRKALRAILNATADGAGARLDIVD